MRDIFVLFIHVLVTAFRLARPGGFRSVIAESALVRATACWLVDRPSRVSVNRFDSPISCA